MCVIILASFQATHMVYADNLEGLNSNLIESNLHFINRSFLKGVGNIHVHVNLEILCGLPATGKDFKFGRKQNKQTPKQTNNKIKMYICFFLVAQDYLLILENVHSKTILFLIDKKGDKIESQLTVPTFWTTHNFFPPQ